ncbi:hypothetical protein J437_LFUL017837 [Ladona fulva]|uniref:Uncharacterized protein n=1 Tax=Ladona fulva TaxID=123851 RepID=A0A8K0KSY9_LADFU|nr:hypothetical protein J437_LFUL017837 [Ladona fulva]
MDAKKYCLKWNNFSDNILSSLENLWGDEDFVDVTIACDGESLKAHKVVLSACSSYMKRLLKENPCQHPIIILKDVGLRELKALMNFMYNGQVMVEEDQIPILLHTAEMLEIRGLSDVTKHNKGKGEGKRNASDAMDSVNPSKKKRPIPMLQSILTNSSKGGSQDGKIGEDGDQDGSEGQGENTSSSSSSSLAQDRQNSDDRGGGDGGDVGDSRKGMSQVKEEIHDGEEEEEDGDDGEDDREEEEGDEGDEEEGMEDEDLEEGQDGGYGEERDDHGMEEAGAPPLEPLMSAVAQLKDPVSHNKNDSYEPQGPNKVMLPPLGSHNTSEIERLRKMDETLSHGDVLIIGETHITPTKCPPRQLKGVSTLKQDYSGHPQNDISVKPVGNHYGMDMNYRMDMQRKMESERLRIKSIDRLKPETAYNDPMVNMRHSAPYPTNPPMPNNMPQQVQQGDYSMQDGGVGMADVSGLPGVGVPNLPPELHLKMLTCPDFKKYTNMLLVAVFGRDVLASHCLNGSKGSSKPRLDRDKVTRVIATVMQKFDVPASTVREAIRVKLNNEDKLKKRARRATLAMLPQVAAFDPEKLLT